MSLLSGLAHLAGDVASPVLNGVGAVTGINSLTQTGHNIASPTATLSNPTGLFNAAPAFTVGPAHNTSSASPATHPNAVSGGATTTQDSGYSTGGGSGAIANPNQALIDQINMSLGRLPTQLQTATNNVLQQYGTNENELNTAKNQANTQYNQGTVANTQQHVANNNQIADQASTGLRSLLATLGAHGAGGSSTAQYLAPQGVAEIASQQRAGAGQTFGQNQQTLDTNWNNYLGDYGNSQKKLDDWKQQNLQQAQSTSDTNKSNLLTQLAGLQSSTGAAMPYVQQANSLLGQVDQLANFNPTYNGTTPTYTAPTVASYSVNPAAPVQQATNATDNTVSPYLTSLLGLDKDKQTTPIIS